MNKNIIISKMSFDEALDASLALAKKIEEEGLTDFGVIGIAIGGILPAKIISEYFKCPLIVIKIARPMTSMKKYFLLDRLPNKLKKTLRRIEMSLGFYRLMEKREIISIIGELSQNKYVIVDDSLDTGKTVSAVVNLLEKDRKICNKNILIAVITQIFDDAVPKADCYIYKNYNFSFPWSRDSNEYAKFLDYCKKNPMLSSFQSLD